MFSFRAFSRVPANRVRRAARVTLLQMNSRHRRTLAASLCAAVLLCAAARTPAEGIYKQVDAAGRITYSDQPDPAATPVAAPARKASSATINAKEATLRLDKARVQREQGSRPLPGEMVKGGGATNVNHRYWRRQEKLRIQVEQAQRRSNETSRLLLAQR